MRRVGFAGVSALFCIVFLLLSCDIDPMDAIIQDPVTVRFYNGETLFREVTVERGADVPMPSTNPGREGHDFLHWYRTTSGGEERAYSAGQVLRTEGMPAEMDTVKMYARFMNVAFPHEVSNVSHSLAPFHDPDAPPGWHNPDFKTLTLIWTNPANTDFSHVKIFNGTRASIVDDSQYYLKSEPGADSVSLVMFFGASSDAIVFTIRAVDIHNNMSPGFEYMFWPPSGDW